jgi:transposase-like protein
MRFPRRTVQTALRLHFEQGLSCYSIANLLAARGEKVSHVSVFKWIRKYEPLREQFLRAGTVREVKQALLERAAK